jgi:hypothetical protein
LESSSPPVALAEVVTSLLMVAPPLSPLPTTGLLDPETSPLVTSTCVSLPVLNTTSLGSEWFWPPRLSAW